MISALNGGPYAICVNVPRSDLLDPCAWSSEPPLVRVAADSTSSGNVRLETGALLRVRIEDPRKVVATPFHQADPGREPLEVGVFLRDRSLYNATWMSSDRRGHDYEVRVPLGTELQFAIRPGKLKVFDDKGAPAPTQSVMTLDKLSPKRILLRVEPALQP